MKCRAIHPANSMISATRCYAKAERDAEERPATNRILLRICERDPPGKSRHIPTHTASGRVGTLGLRIPAASCTTAIVATACAHPKYAR